MKTYRLPCGGWRFDDFALFTQTGVIASAAKQSPDDANEIASSLRSSQ
jgi:hypothetical protein